MLLYKTIKLDIDEQAIIKVLSNELRGWVGFSLDTENSSLQIGRVSEGGYYAKRWTQVEEKLKPYIDLSQIDFDPEKSLVSKTGPGGFAKPHYDLGRSVALLIPLGDNKGKLTFHMPYRHLPIWQHQYTGPTLIRSTVLHSMLNTSKKERYCIQLHIR
jgi:hypothetical protein